MICLIYKISFIYHITYRYNKTVHQYALSYNGMFGNNGLTN